MTGVYLYRGVVIFRATAPGWRLRYTARGGFAADTLAGIKRLIRDAQS